MPDLDKKYTLVLGSTLVNPSLEVLEAAIDKELRPQVGEPSVVLKLTIAAELMNQTKRAEIEPAVYRGTIDEIVAEFRRNLEAAADRADQAESLWNRDDRHWTEDHEGSWSPGHWAGSQERFLALSFGTMLPYRLTLDRPVDPRPPGIETFPE